MAKGGCHLIHDVSWPLTSDNRRDNDVTPSGDGDLQLSEGHVVQLACLLAEGVPHELLDRPEHSREDVAVDVRLKSAGKVPDKHTTAVKEEDFLDHRTFGRRRSQSSRLSPLGTSVEKIGQDGEPQALNQDETYYKDDYSIRELDHGEISSVQGSRGWI